MSYAISLHNVFVRFGRATVLEDINLAIAETEFLGIIGPNGGGKTTLLKLILGLIKQESGIVKIFDKPLRENTGAIGYVPQYSEFQKDFPISVYDVVMMGRIGSRSLGKRLSPEDKAIVEDALSQVDLHSQKKELVGNLSGGQKQRTLIARALATQPRILLLDEPTASIDSKTGKSIFELLNQLNKTTTIIMVSHDIGAISKHVKKIACLNKKLVFHDSKEITKEMLEATYHCPVDLIAHGVPHRVLDKH